jgi:hypothetical protein
MVRVPSEDFGRVVNAMVSTDPASPYSIAVALLNAGFDNAVETFERAKQEWINGRFDPWSAGAKGQPNAGRDARLTVADRV